MHSCVVCSPHQLLLSIYKLSTHIPTNIAPSVTNILVIWPKKTLTKPYTIAGKAMVTYVQNCLVISINLDLSAYSNG